MFCDVCNLRALFGCGATAHVIDIETCLVIRRSKCGVQSALHEGFTKTFVISLHDWIHPMFVFRGTASFAVLNIPHLEHLGLRLLREVSSGDVVIRNNPRLCYTGDGNYWRSLLRLEKQRYIVAKNADQETCGENLQYGTP